VLDILRFFREANALDALAQAQGVDADQPLGAWLRERGYHDAFVGRHIVPMASAIWSAPPDRILAFPVASFARFFANHGLLQVRRRPQWRTVRGGSRAYVDRVMSDFPGEVLTEQPVVTVSRDPDGVAVRTRDGQSRRFDRCLLACHADDALGMLTDAGDDERRILGAFRYQPNEAVLHTDDRLMPRRRRLWSSWNYVGDAAQGHADSCGVTYWMNKLQPLPTLRNYFVSLNPAAEIPASAVVGRYTYRHPMFDGAAMAAQRGLWRLQGARSTWFAGAWATYGFHEDGLQAGLAAAESMGGELRPWSVPPGQNRLPHAYPAYAPRQDAPQVSRVG
jgi:uncharacterized protein